MAVIGGGIAGITAAMLLKRSGTLVALLEGCRVGRQVTGHSNAKITSQHSLIYADLIERLGEEAAQLYADANQAGLQRITRGARSTAGTSAGRPIPSPRFRTGGAQERNEVTAA